MAINLKKETKQTKKVTTKDLEARLGIAGTALDSVDTKQTTESETETMSEVNETVTTEETATVETADQVTESSQEPEQTTSEVIETESNEPVSVEKTVSNLAVGDQVLLTHTVRGKVKKELKTVTDIGKSFVKCESMRFYSANGFGCPGASEGKRITIPSESDLLELQEAENQKEAFSEAKFKLLELSSVLEQSKVNSSALKQFISKADELALMLK